MPETAGLPPELRQPSPESQDVSPAAALNQLLGTVRRHPLAFAAVFAVCVLAAAGYLAHRSPTYSATAQILVTPIPASDTSYIGLPLIRAAELEPQRAAATAAPLLVSTAADKATAEATGLTTAEVTAGVDVAAVPDSNLVEVKAIGIDSADAATELADAYAKASIQVREEFLEPQIRQAIRVAEKQLELLPESVGPEANTVGTRIANLRTILRQGDPTLAFARPAPAGTIEGGSSRTIILVAIFTGLVLAGLTTVMIELLTARPIDTEEVLIDLYRLPILARISAGGRRESDFARRRWARGEGSVTVRDGFRTLRAQLSAREEERAAPLNAPASATVTLISAEEMEARSVASLNLARAFAAADETATVVEMDVRRPRLASMLGLRPRGDLTALLRAEPPRSAVTELEGEPGVGLLAAPAAADPPTLEALTVNSGRLVDVVKTTASWVIVDAPPLAEATADALAVLGAAEHLVVVVRLGSTRPEALLRLAEAVDQQGLVPDGYLVLTGGASRASRAP